jgi:hypothetical protein
VLPVIDKPLDLFKAIFEDDVTESGSEEDEEEQQQQQQQQHRAAREVEAAAAPGQQLALVNGGAAGRDGEEQRQQERDARSGRKLGASDAPGAKGGWRLTQCLSGACTAVDSTAVRLERARKYCLLSLGSHRVSGTAVDSHCVAAASLALCSCAYRSSRSVHAAD